MNTKKIFLSGIVIWIVSTIFAWLTCGWIFNWVYEIPPLIWKDPTAMFTTSALIWTNILGLLIAIVFALVYSFIYKAIPGKGAKKE